MQVWVWASAIRCCCLIRLLFGFVLVVIWLRCGTVCSLVLRRLCGAFGVLVGFGLVCLRFCGLLGFTV